MTEQSPGSPTPPPPVIEAPRSPAGRPRPDGAGREFHLWLFMRVSGVALVVLVLGHLLVTNVLDGGVQRINFAYVAGRWASPFWQLWDLLMLWLAMIHGCIGMCAIVDDYARRARTRLLLKYLLYSATTVTIALGTLVLFTFDPTLG